MFCQIHSLCSECCFRTIRPKLSLSSNHTWGYDAEATLHLEDFKARRKMLTKADTQNLEVSLPFRLTMRCEQLHISCRWKKTIYKSFRMQHHSWLTDCFALFIWLLDCVQSVSLTDWARAREVDKNLQPDMGGGETGQDVLSDWQHSPKLTNAGVQRGPLRQVVNIKMCHCASVFFTYSWTIRDCAITSF